MCAKSSYNWSSDRKPMTVEDVLETIRNGGHVFLHEDRIITSDDNDSAYMPAGYGLANGTIPGDAEPLEINPDNKEDVNFLASFMQNGEKVEMTNDSMYPTKIREILPEDTIKEEVVTISYESWANAIDNGDAVPNLIKEKHEYTQFEKLCYAMNKASNKYIMLAVLKKATRLAYPTEVQLDKDNNPIEVEAAPEQTLLFSELHQIQILFKRRMQSLTPRSERQADFYERKIKQAYSQKFLRILADKIKQDELITESLKVRLRKVFNMQDYAICKSYRENTGRFIPMICKSRA